MKIIVAIFLFSIAAVAQSDLTRTHSKSFVTGGGIPAVSVEAGKTAQVEIKFRVNPGYHVNSHTPGSDLLIPTTLEFQALDKVKTGKILYPAGEQLALEFSPKEKISVYSGDLVTTVPIIAAKDAKAGTYVIKGELHYQACNSNACFPPKSFPVEVSVVVKPKE